MTDRDIVQQYSRIIPAIILVLLFLYPGTIIGTVNAADAYYEGYLGDVVDIHGVSYSGNEIYLFLTGPNLPTNGVTLSDLSQQADQGHFTIVTLDSNQEWSYKWNTLRLQTQLDPGTYTIYVTTEPVDLANLGGSSTYKTLEVYLQDTHAPQGESGPGTYTLNPERHTSSPMPTIVTGSGNMTPSPGLTTPVQTSPVVITPEIINTTAPELAPMPATTKAGLFPGIPLFAVAGIFCLILIRRLRS